MLRTDLLARTPLKLRHLQLLVALDETRTLARAAQRLRTTQPAASRQLAEIEAIAGVAIFDRLPRGLSPNGYGEVMLRRARIALTELSLAAAELDEMRSGRSGSVALGAVTAPALDTLVPVLSALQRSHPRLRLAVQVDTSPALIRALGESRLDFALARIPPDVDARALHYREVAEEELVFLVRAGHPLLDRADPTLAGLAELSWVLQPPGTLLRKRVDLAFRAAGLAPPTRVLDTPSVVLTLASILRSDSVAVLSASVVALFGPDGPVRRLPPLADAPRIEVEPFGLIHQRDRPFSPAAQFVFSAVEAALFGEPEAGKQGRGPASDSAKGKPLESVS